MPPRSEIGYLFNDLQAAKERIEKLEPLSLQPLVKIEYIYDDEQDQSPHVTTKEVPYTAVELAGGLNPLERGDPLAITGTIDQFVESVQKAACLQMMYDRKLEPRQESPMMMPVDPEQMTPLIRGLPDSLKPIVICGKNNTKYWGELKIDVIIPTTQPIVVLNPKIFEIGPYVIRNTGLQQMLFNPAWSLKQVELSMQNNVSDIQPACSPFLKTSYEGWTTWLQKRTLTMKRTQRDLTGVLGTGLGVLNSIDSEVIMNKLAASISDLARLQQPLRSSLLALGTNQWLLSSILPTWERINVRDHELITDALGVIQNNLSLTLSCIQAQLWMQSVAASIIREGEEGTLPTEIRKIIWDSATDFEKELQSWWSLVNFTYDPVTNTATTFVLTISNATKYSIYPIIALGINHNGTILYPSEHRVWARKMNEKWQTVNLESCIVREQQGFVCEGNAIEAQDICLDTEQNICHFEVHPNENPETILVYIGKGCVCLRTVCDFLYVDEVVVEIRNNSNFCICNFTKIDGCDFSYSTPVTSHQLLQSNYMLIHELLPIPIGMNLTLVKQLLRHKDLIEILEKIKENGQKTLITVHHNVKEIHRVFERVQRDAELKWWDTLFGWSPTATGILNKLCHPIVILLTLVLIMICGKNNTKYWGELKIDVIIPTTQPIVVLNPKIFEIGPYVIRNTGLQQMLFNPAWSLKQVELSMQNNVSDIQPACSPFLKTSYEGWTTWLQKRTLTMKRTQRDLTGVLGTGLGVLNSIDSEVIMNKLAASISDLARLQQPLRSSLLALGTNQWLLSSILPTWERINVRDHELITDALGVIQNNLSLTLSCIQAQLWMQSVAASIIREGEEGTLPTEIRKIIWDSATDFEKELQSWWSLVNFTYDPVTNTATTFVLTISNATKYSIYPIIALGINHNGTILYPSEHRVWARKMNEKWQTVNLESCIVREQQGFVCEGNAIEAQDICLDTEQNICHFEVHPNENPETILVYIGKGCVCLRTVCDFLYVDEVVVEIRNNSNFCICNFTKIDGCDFSYSTPVTSHQLLQSNYMLIHELLPIPIGMNLTLVKQLLRHKDLIEILEKIKENGQKTLITVHHNVKEIHRVFERVQRDAELKWWDTLFGWSPTATGILNKLCHPIVILLTLVLIMICGKNNTKYWGELKIDVIIPTTQPIVVLNPKIFEIGPYVIRNTGLQQMLFNPAWSLKQVELSMQNNVSDIQPACSPFLKTSYEGWTTWLQKRTLTMKRTQRDLTGVLGTGLGVLNSIDSEVIMNKLAASISDLARLQQPLRSSLLALGTNQWLLSSILPTWERINVRDHELITDALGVIQNNLSLTLSCIQAQLWMQSVAASIIREGEEGTLPTEIRKIIWDSATDFEKELQSWWSLVNFTYDPVTNTATTFVLTISNATKYSIYPIIALGINHNGTILYPSEHRVWARKMNEKWQTVNLESCIVREQQGFVCEGNAIEAQDICLDTEQNICHFEVHPNENPETILVYIGKGCVCLRTVCDFLYVDEVVVEIRNNSNFCICNFTKIDGCDFSYSTPVTSHQLLQSNYMLIHELLPIPIGMNLTLVKQLLRHKDLIEILEKIKENGQKTLITVHHNVKEIHRVFERVQRDAELKWWDTLFGWSPTATGILNKLCHPIVILLTLVLIMWPVRKPNGMWRLTVDYRRLNANTGPLTAAVSNIAELIATIQERAHPVMATVDVKDMFFMVPLQPEDQDRFAFTS
ncbi:uncharacterized protein LOC142599343 [Balearica regulorum gibbericeps]|uniref:uncharacterized protein LOC142599343 n=1 Tax=Balearica regulorum gibbericeps TaxID=100784 RepID=UPI003F601738